VLIFFSIINLQKKNRIFALHHKGFGLPVVCLRGCVMQPLFLFNNLRITERKRIFEPVKSFSHI
jgi:hypothetical protein